MTPFFFIIGPLRTGSSLLSRCIDDHENAICLCETEINRVLFPPYFTRLHGIRMRAHGLDEAAVLRFLDRRPQRDIDAMMDWYRKLLPVVSRGYNKKDVRAYGDKSPDFYTAPEIVAHFLKNYRLIYTVRDPRAIVRSIWRSENSSDSERENRWNNLIGNIREWQPHWDADNVMVSRYEDLVTGPLAHMQKIYGLLDLPESSRFLQDFARLFPRRFLWKTSVDMKTGAARDFDPEKAAINDADIAPELLERLQSSPEIAAYCEQFGYRI